MMAKKGEKVRIIPDWEIRNQLQKLVDAGVDIDSLPGSWTVADLFDFRRMEEMPRLRPAPDVTEEN